MSIRHLTLLSVIPLFCAQASLAQAAPAEPAAEPADKHHAVDPITRHKEFCTEHYAREAGRFAYLEAELNLTDPQRSAWAKWKQSVLDGSAKQRDLCLEDAQKAGKPVTAPEREASEEKMLSLRLQTLQASRPELQTVYDTLSPEQKAILDRPHHREKPRSDGKR